MKLSYEKLQTFAGREAEFKHRQLLRTLTGFVSFFV